MSLLKIIIEGEELELNESVTVPLTRTFEDLENPTSIKNDYSKTVKVPLTKKNNNIFGHIYNPDRLTGKETTGSLTGVYFDPYKKLDMRLEWNDNVVMVGYAKMLSVSSDGYSLSLNGELGKVFQELQKITFDEHQFDTTTDKGKEDIKKYWIDGGEYVNEKINRGLVYASWQSDGQSTLELKKKTDAGYKVTDIIGFTPNNAFNSDFDYKTFQTAQKKSKLFSEVLEEKAKTILDKEGNPQSYVDITGVTGETAVREGMYPREIGEYRSYLQLPFIYFNKLFKIFQQKAEATTGYSFVLDERWFNNTNIYWTNLALELMDYSQIVKQNKSVLSPNVTSSADNLIVGDTTSTKDVGTIIKFNNVKPAFYDSTYNFFKASSTKTLSFKNIKISFDWSVEGKSDYRFIHQATGSYFILYVAFKQYGKSNYVSDMVRIAVAFNGDKSRIPESSYDYFVGTGDFVQNGSTFTCHIEQEIQLPIIEEGNVNTQLVYGVGWRNVGNGPFYWEDRYDNIGVAFLNQTFLNFSAGNNIIVSQNDVTFRSNTYFTLNNLWSNSYGVWTTILNYCKMFKIKIIADELHNTLLFTQQKDYFKDYKIVDWSSKIDKTKDFIITPVTWDKKYILFNYEDIKGDIAEAYKTTYNYNYGDKRITTKYNFNDDENKLFSKVYGTVISTDNVLSWTSLYDELDVIYTIAAEQYIANKDKDGKIVANFGNFFFVNKAQFDTDNDLRNVYISDDTQLQNQTQKYFYSQYEEHIQSLSYQRPELKLNNMLCMFNKPLESYVYDNDYYDNCSALYDLFWAKYIAERYNTQNKIVTCYLDLTPEDYAGFEFNHFITIENQLYMVNKIYDYDITNNESTKVDLITIQDIEGYTTNNFK